MISSHDIRAYIGSTELATIEASVSLDESWAPYVQGSITIPTPDAATLALLDPRENPRVTLYLEQFFGTSHPFSDLTTAWTGKYWSNITTDYAGKTWASITSAYYEPFNTAGVIPSVRRYFSLGIRSRTMNYRNGTTTLELASDEALLQDYALIDTTAYEPGITSVRAVVADVLKRIGAFLETGTADATIASGASTWDPGQSAWDYVAPLVQAGSLRLYCDEFRAWRLVTDDTQSAQSTALTYTGTITEADDVISRDSDWADAVIITYKWTDALGAQHTAYDSASEVGFSKVVSLTYETEYPGAGAAARVLQRRNATGQSREVTAISSYDLIPTQNITISLPDAEDAVAILAAVSWNLPSDEMSIRTRGITNIPEQAWLKNPAGYAWQSVSAGISWNTYTHP